MQTIDKKRRLFSRRTGLGKQFAFFFLPAIALLIFVLAGFYLTHSRGDMAILKASEKANLGHEEAMDRGIFSNITADLRIIAASPVLAEFLDQGGRESREKLSRMFCNLAANRKLYDQVRYLDRHGLERLRVDFRDNTPKIVPRERLQDKSLRYYFRDTINLARGQIYISPMDLNIEYGRIEQPLKPMIRFGTPVYDRKGEKRGVIILNYLGRLLFEHLRDFSAAAKDDDSGSDMMSTRLGEITGVPILINRDAYFLLSDNPADEWGFMLGHKRTFASRFPDEWRIIQRRKKGQFRSRHGLFTFTTITPLRGDVVSSTGSPQPFQASRAVLAPAEIIWKQISFVNPEQLSRFSADAKRHTLMLFAILTAFLVPVCLTMASARLYRIKSEQERERIIAELREALARVKTLSGFIPICASCKKIRDDEGYWKQLEAYLSQHSDARFSHGICPECAEKLYPELCEEMNSPAETPRPPGKI